MRTIRLLPPVVRITRFTFAATIVWALAFSACERKSTTEYTTPPVDPTVLSPSVQPAQPVAITRTFETSHLGNAIDTFEKDPTLENQSTVKLAFSQLDVEIAKLEDRVVKTTGSDQADASAKLVNLKNYRAEEAARFTRAETPVPVVVTPPGDSRSLAQKVGDKADRVGNKIENGARNVGETLKNAARNTGEAVKDATH